ncbi:MAG: alpha/beta hydrolase, partial [Candidatus Binataceae bacterium]
MNSPDEEPPSPRVGVDTDEFLFPGAGLSVLLIHGLTGTPYEMRYLGEHLAAAGIRAMGTRLAGHGGAPEELGAVTYNDWYESVVEGFERLRSFGDPIVVVGLSAGAVLGARLAEDQGEAVAGLVLLAPAFFLPMWIRAALTVASSCGSWARRIYMQGRGSDIHDTAAREIHPSNHLMPLSAPLALIELSAMVRSRLGKIMQPVLIIQSRRDHI